MIEVLVTDEHGELGKLRIEQTAIHRDGTADYSIQFAVDRLGAVGLHQRAVYRFPCNQMNVLALLRQALNTLDEKELRLEPEPRTSNMARRLRRALPPFRT